MRPAPKLGSERRPDVSPTGLSLLDSNRLQDYLGRISVIMPAYNEENVIAYSVHETARVLSEAGCDFEIIIVDDGSRDDTYRRAVAAGLSRRNVKVVKNRSNGGKGEAVKQGFRHVTGDLVAMLDADMDLHPEQIGTLFEYMQATDADVVIGSKRHPESIIDYPRHRRLMSNVYYLLVKTLFGLPVRDTQTGIKLFCREVLEDVFPKVIVKKYAFDLELLVNAHSMGYKIQEAPITLDFQRHSARMALKDIFHIILDTFGIFYRLRLTRFYKDEEQLEESPSVSRSNR